jgi:hypothetical protein
MIGLAAAPDRRFRASRGSDWGKALRFASASLKPNNVLGHLVCDQEPPPIDRKLTHYRRRGSGSVWHAEA